MARDGFTRLRDAMATAAAQPVHTQAGEPAGDIGAVRRAAHAYLDFALTEPELYQLMYGLGGIRVPTANTMREGQAVGDVLIILLERAGDQHTQQHVLRLWATAHGLLALLAVGRVDVDSNQLHAQLDAAINDTLRALPTPAAPRSTPLLPNSTVGLAGLDQKTLLLSSGA